MKHNFQVTRMWCAVTVVGLLLSTGAGAASVTLSAPDPMEGGRFGEVVAGLDDLNASGAADVLVGAPQEDFAGTDVAGAAYVFDGGTGALLYELNSPNPGIGGLFGQAVTGLDDVTGDGVGDFAIGAPHDFALASAAGVGRVYVYDGASGDVVQTIAPVDLDDVSFGFVLASLLDITGDGIGDLAVSGLQEAEGEVFLFDGVSGAHLLTLRSPNPRTPGKFGGSLAGLDDVSGDGVPDILVGAWFEDSGSLVFAGRVYVFDGAAGTLLYEVLSPTPSVSGTFGFRVDAVPDFDSDGMMDIVVAASAETTGVPAGGKVYVYSGSTGQLIHTLRSPHESENQVFGPAVSGIDDIDGDGRGDVVVGAWAEHNGTTFTAGRVYVFSGATGGSLLEIVSPMAVMDGSFGWDVRDAGDINADGLADILVSAPGEDKTDISPDFPYEEVILRSAGLV